MTNSPNPDDIGFSLDALLAQFANEVNEGTGGGNVLSLKPGDYWIKLRMPEGRQWPGRFFETYTAQFAEGPTKYILLTGVVTRASVEGIADKAKIRYIKINRTQYNMLNKVIASGWDLFGEVGAPVLFTVTKVNDKKSEYTVGIQPGQIDTSTAEYPEQSIEDIVKDHEAFSDRMAKKNAGAAAAPNGPMAFN
jgi:hypothetical protein